MASPYEVRILVGQRSAWLALGWLLVMEGRRDKRKAPFGGVNLFFFGAKPHWLDTSKKTFEGEGFLVRRQFAGSVTTVGANFPRCFSEDRGWL